MHHTGMPQIENDIATEAVVCLTKHRYFYAHAIKLQMGNIYTYNRYQYGK